MRLPYWTVLEPRVLFLGNFSSWDLRNSFQVLCSVCLIRRGCFKCCVGKDGDPTWTYRERVRWMTTCVWEKLPWRASHFSPISYFKCFLMSERKFFTPPVPVWSRFPYVWITRLWEILFSLSIKGEILKLMPHSPQITLSPIHTTLSQEKTQGHGARQASFG